MTLTGFRTDHRPAGWCGASPERWFTAPVHPVPSAAVASDLDPLEQHLVTALRALSREAGGPPAPDEAQAAWRAQVASRAIDHAARWLQEQRLGFYTIGSAGHESNALVALALRPTDPALLHYRSGGFYLARADAGRPRRRRGRPARDGGGRSEEPIAGGRHKVFGHRDLAIIPQTSTIASHLPRAVGVAFAIERARVSASTPPWPRRTRSSCARSATHRSTTRPRRPRSTPRRSSRTSGQPLPLLFVCEDNGLGISVPTPEAWVEQSLHGRPELAVERVEGDDPAQCSRPRASSGSGCGSTATRRSCISARCATSSHAGADLETAYRAGRRSGRLRRATRCSRPGAGWSTTGARSGEELADDYLAVRARVRERALARDGAAAARYRRRTSCGRSRRATPAPSPRRRRRRPSEHGDERADARAGGQRSARDVLERHPEALVFGEDVGVKGGVYGVTRGLQGASAPSASSTRCSTRRRSSGSRSARRSRASSRSRRSSTSRTSTTPRISCAARRRRSSSSRRARTGTGWSSGSRATATRKASAVTSTTTTGSACCATSRAS